MNRFALFVDAGYFFAGGAEAAFEHPVPRHAYRIEDLEKCLVDLRNIAQDRCPGQEFLRIYWYDAPPKTGLSIEQSTLALQPGMKLRLGVLNNVGEQKGVDSLIVTDLIELARNRAISDAVLISGDEDIRIGVAVAQTFGLRVHLMGVGNHDRNVSRSLRMEADSFHGIDPDWCKKVLMLTGETAAQQTFIQTPTGTPTDLESAAKTVCEKILEGKSVPEIREIRTLVTQSRQVPMEIDRKLIATTAKHMGDVKLTPEELRKVREVFREYLELL